MILASLIIQAIAFVSLVAIWYFFGFKDATPCLSGGLWTFLSISFVMDTSITVEKVQAYIQGQFAVRIVSQYVRNRGESGEEYKDEDANVIREWARRYVDQFSGLLKIPNKVYPFFGMAFALLILAMSYFGIKQSDPICPFLIMAPLPALLYYLVVFYVFVFVYLHFACECPRGDVEKRDRIESFKAKIMAQLNGDVK